MLRNEYVERRRPKKPQFLVMSIARDLALAIYSKSYHDVTKIYSLNLSRARNATKNSKS